MRFSTRTRYGLRLLVRLAAQPQGRLVQLAQVASEEDMSSGYLEQIVRALRPMGILRSARGVGGGYALAKSPDEINLEEVFRHLEGDISPVRCVSGRSRCAREGLCLSQPFWRKLDEHIRSFLRQHTLRDILESGPTL